MNRPEIYDLRALELGLDMQTSQIVSEMNLMGWKINESTMSRLRNGSDLNIDIAGLPFFAIRCLFPSAVACAAQTATWMVRHALAQKLKGDELDEVLLEAKEQLVHAQDLLDQLKVPADDETTADRALDRASIAEGYGQVLATRDKHHAALGKFLEAYTTLLPHARRAGCSIGILICLGRVLGAALSEAWDCDEQAGRLIGTERVGFDWYLWKVLKHYKAPSPLPLLTDGVNRTGDDRVAANHSDGFALAGLPREAARMIEIGMAHAEPGTTLETWQPIGRSAPVVAEPYMKDAVAEYRRLKDKQKSPNANINNKARIMTRVIAIIVGLATLIALVTHIDPAKARPERITGIQSATNVG